MEAFQTDLEELLNKRIDLVSEGGIYPRLRERILQDAREF
jgi:predicted nucleotidyltransferase